MATPPQNSPPTTLPAANLSPSLPPATRPPRAVALAVGIHNVPEGLIVAAPIYAATGSRTRAFGVALLSGLSEPLGALFALLFVKPYLTPLRLQYMLACVGGIMTAVCWLELWPAARGCKNDGALARGVLLGGVVMASTLVLV